MTLAWIVQGLFALANVGLLIGIVLLRNQEVPVAQADFELFLWMVGIGAASIVSSVISLIVGGLINLKTTNSVLHLLLKRPFGLICLFNVLAPIFSFLVFPRG